MKADTWLTLIHLINSKKHESMILVHQYRYTAFINTIQAGLLVASNKVLLKEANSKTNRCRTSNILYFRV